MNIAKLVSFFLCMIVINCNGMDDEQFPARNPSGDNSGTIPEWGGESCFTEDIFSEFPMFPKDSSDEEISEEVTERIKIWNELSSQVPEEILKLYLEGYQISPSQLKGKNLQKFLKVDTQWALLNENEGVRGQIKAHLDRLAYVNSSLSDLSEEQQLWFTQGRLGKHMENAELAKHFFSTQQGFYFFCEFSTEEAEKMGMNKYVSNKRETFARRRLTPNKEIWEALEKDIGMYLGKEPPLSFTDIKDVARTISEKLGIALLRDECHFPSALKVWYINNIDMIKPYLASHRNAK